MTTSFDAVAQSLPISCALLEAFKHLQNFCAVFLHPYAALPAAFTDVQVHGCAIKAQNRMIILRNLLGIGVNIISDQRAPEAVIGAVGETAVNQLTVEKEDIFRFQILWLGLHIGG